MKLLTGICSHVDSITAVMKNGTESYTYVFQLCGDAWGVPRAGVIQLDSMKMEEKPTVIGMYNATQAIGGSKSLQNITISP